LNLQRRKGIRSLIPTGRLTESEELIQEVPVEKLSPSPFQPRTTVDEEALQELVESVKIHGILQPLVARRSGSGFQLIAGERRLRAARQAGLERVPVVLREATDREMLELALVENIQREDINPMEAAEAYRRLMEEFSLTQEEVGDRVGKSRSAVANTVRLLSLPNVIQDSLRRGEIDEGHGKVLAGLAEERLALRLWRRVVRRGLSVRETEAAAAKLSGRSVPRGTHPQPIPLDPNLVEVQDRLTEKLGAKTRLRPRPKGGGVIEIEYADQDDLDRVFWTITG
jgi:ParB family chromosome partitioning protein